MNLSQGNNGNGNKVRLTVDNWVALVTLIVTCCGGLYATLNSRFAEIEKRQIDHEIRLTRRETNAITWQQANDLSSAVTKLSVEVVQQQKTLERQQSEVKDCLKKVEESLANDVLSEVRQLREALKRNQ